MQCATCDERLPDDAMFCPNCGRNVTPVFTASVPQASASYDPPSAAQDSENDLPLSPVQPATQQKSAAYAVYTPRSTTAVISLVFGILAWCLIPLAGALAAIAVGHIARREIRASGGALRGNGTALAGLVLGYAQFVPLGIAACLLLRSLG